MKFNPKFQPTKIAEDTNCDVDEFDADGSHTLSSSLSRMKRQAYSPKGILDIVKVFSKTMANEGRDAISVISRLFLEF